VGGSRLTPIYHGKSKSAKALLKAVWR